MLERWFTSAYRLAEKNFLLLMVHIGVLKRITTGFSIISFYLSIGEYIYIYIDGVKRKIHTYMGE